MPSNMLWFVNDAAAMGGIMVTVNLKRSLMLPPVYPEPSMVAAYSFTQSSKTTMHWWTKFWLAYTVWD
jgi:hypothetical protein